MKSIFAGALVAAVIAIAPPAAAAYHGTDGADTFVGTASADRAYLGDGNDVARGYGGADVLIGGDGRDRLDGGAGVDQLLGGKGADELTGGSGGDRIFGGLGADQATPGTGADKVKLGKENDETLLEVDGATDIVWCGSGYDTVVFLNRDDPHDVLHDCEEILTLVITPRG